MADKHAVVRTDLLMGTHDGSLLCSVRYMGAGTTATAIDNGNVVAVGALEALTGKDREREVRVATTPTASTKIADIALIANPEVIYDERMHNLHDYVNEAGKAVRGYFLHSRDKFGVTEEALDHAAEIAVGDKVEIQASTKLKVAKSSSAAIGSIYAIEKAGIYTYYVIEIA